MNSEKQSESVEWTQYSIRPKRSAECNSRFPGPTRVVDAKLFLQGSLGVDRPMTDQQTTLLGR